MGRDYGYRSTFDKYNELIKSHSQDPRQSRGLEIALEGHNTDKAPQGAAKGSANCIADSWRPLKGLILRLGILATRKRVNELLHTHLVRNFIFSQLLLDVFAYFHALLYRQSILLPKNVCPHICISNLHACQKSSDYFFL